MDYQQAAVPAPGTDACQPRLARLRTVAFGVLSSHVNDHSRYGVWGVSGRATALSWLNTTWPCAAARAGSDHRNQ